MVWCMHLQPGNDGKDILSGSPGDCPAALAVTAMSDYDGTPGGLSTPAGIKSNPDDKYSDFSNYSKVRSQRMLAAPGGC